MDFDLEVLLETDPEIIILEDNEDHYVADVNGFRKIIVKINKNEIKSLHTRSIKVVAIAFNKDHITEIVSKLESILNNIPNIKDYRQISDELVCKLESFYKIVGSPNLFHHYIKNISNGDCDIFLKNINNLYKEMIEVANEMVKMKKLKNVNYYNCKMKKIEIIVNKNEKKLFSLKNVRNWFESEVIQYRTEIV